MHAVPGVLSGLKPSVHMQCGSLSTVSGHNGVQVKQFSAHMPQQPVGPAGASWVGCQGGPVCMHVQQHPVDLVLCAGVDSKWRKYDSSLVGHWPEHLDRAPAGIIQEKRDYKQGCS